MLGKIIDGKLTYPPHRIVLDGMQIFNPAGKTIEQRVTDLENNQNDMNRVFEEVVNSESGIL